MKLLFLISLLFCLYSIQAFKIQEKPKTNSFKQTQLWFDYQLINHFDVQDNRTYSQRYWVMDQFYDRKVGPVFLYICGEYTCSGIPDERQYPGVLAQKFNALVLVLEHRFYGASQPFGNDSWSIENLRYLTINLALADLAYFIQWSKDTQVYGITQNTPWITIGGSYPGALSGWFRYKYPHLTVGALASSAVVNSILDFVEFDAQIRTSTLKSGPQCTEAIQNLTKMAEFYLSDVDLREDFLASFNAQKLLNQEFLFFFADIFVELVQYGKREFLCDLLQNKTLSQQMDSIRNYSLASAPPESYAVYYIRNETVDINNANRQWTYQTCAEVGWFQTYYPNKTLSMRSTNVTLEFYRQWCKDSFGKDLWPNVENTNLEFGGKNLEAFNVIFTNGGEVKFTKDIFLLKCF